jgi:hypothetical protein
VRTIEGNRWRVSGIGSEVERTGLEEALAKEPVVASVNEMEALPPVVGRGTPASDLYRGPAFVFPEQLPPASTYVEVLGEAADARTVPELSWVRKVTPTERPVTVARNDAGEIVSVCHSARATDRAAEAGVETAPGYRGRGYAVAVVLAWARALLAEGRLPLYSTQRTNTASRAVARRLGLIIYGEDCHD